MNWLNSVVRKRSQKKTLGIVGNDAKTVVSSWRISPEQDESSHDKWWDIAKSHNRWVRIGVKCYPNNLSSEMSTATYIGLRLFKPDFQSDQWQRQGHFSFTVEEIQFRKHRDAFQLPYDYFRSGRRQSLNVVVLTPYVEQRAIHEYFPWLQRYSKRLQQSFFPQSII